MLDGMIKVRTLYLLQIEQMEVLFLGIFFHVVLLKVSAVAGHGSVLHNEALPAASGNKDKPNDTQGPAVILHSLSPNLNFISMQ